MNSRTFYVAAVFAFSVASFAPAAHAQTEAPNEDAATPPSPYTKDPSPWITSGPAPYKPTPESAKKPGWYGYQILIPTIAFDMLAVVGLSLPRDVPTDFPQSNGARALVWTGAFGRTASGPIVHWAHGNIGKGFASLGVESIWMASAGIGFVGSIFVCGLDSSICHYRAISAFALLGGIAGTVIDTTKFAVNRGPAPKETPQAAFFSPFVVPTLARDPRTGEMRTALDFGIAGQF
jgi:hypothetical protein